MPESGPSPANPAPASSDFFDASGIIAGMKEAKAAEDNTAEATQITAKNTQSILDVIKGDIKSTVEKVSSGAKISREDAVLKENNRLKQFGDLISRITRISEGVKGIGVATRGFFEFAINRVVSIGLIIGLGVLAIKSGFASTAKLTQSTLFALRNLPALLLSGSKIGVIVKSVAGLALLIKPLNSFVGQFTTLFANIAASGMTLGEYLKSSAAGLTKLQRFVVNIALFFQRIGKFFTPIFNVIKVISGPILKAVGFLSKILGKLFFPITIGISAIQALFDFFNKGGSGGLTGLLMDFGNRLVENFTFGIINLRDIIGFLDDIATSVRLLIAQFTSSFGTADEIRLGFRQREAERKRSQLVDDLTREVGVNIQTANQIADAATLSISNVQDPELRQRLLDANIAEKFNELQEARTDLFMQTQKMGLDVETVMATTVAANAQQNQNISRILQAMTAETAKGGRFQGTDVPPKPPTYTPKLGGAAAMRGFLEQ